MTERLPCQTEGCVATILPATAAKTGGICMPCQQKKLRLEKEDYIARNRRFVDPYKDVTEPVEILKIMHTPKKHDPLEVLLSYPKSEQELYHNLTPKEVAQMEAYAVQLIEEGELDQAEEILLSLVCFAQATIHLGLDALIQKECFYPGILFKDALPSIRNKIMERIHHDKENRNHLLSALAWIGDEEIVRQFDSWAKSAPRWASELYVSPESFTHEAGWELDDEGNKITLFHSVRYAFKVEDQFTENKAVLALKDSNHTCPWCDGPIEVLFDCNLLDPVLQFLNLEGERLRLAACMRCAAYYGVQFMEIDYQGHMSWSSYNQLPKHFSREIYEDTEPVHLLHMLDQPRGSYEASYWALEVPATQIGGHPTWIQDAEYPSCPSCAETMVFIAQLDMEQVGNSEGIYYTFLCRGCQLSATSFQQT
ncbi:DUF1963 domain-containing protein [Paenibacillus sp. FSL K6-3182]|uniref:DUF1963 domain-containing protein n=1 Tax=Paenibacillus sp. FSL K6-3182 TaxID=2921495 RepID=UPI0030D3D090